jgi:hypothetical protein
MIDVKLYVDCLVRRNLLRSHLRLYVSYLSLDYGSRYLFTVCAKGLCAFPYLPRYALCILNLVPGV